MTAPAFFAEISKRLNSEPLQMEGLSALPSRQRHAPYLSAPFVTEDFDFYRRYLQGAKQIQPRWKRCVRLVDAHLGEALGQAFVRRCSRREQGSARLTMVERIENAMGERHLKHATG